MRRVAVSLLAAIAMGAVVWIAGAAPPRNDRPGWTGRSGHPELPLPSIDAGSVVADATSATPTPCGRDGGVDCPLQAWMKVNAGPPSKTGDIDLLAEAFERIATLAPHAGAYPNWASIAKDGANVTRRGRVDAARVACVSCHEQYRTRFRQHLRETPLEQLSDAGAIEAGKP